MGTPDFAVETLREIIENDYEVVGVITAPDRPAGRGRKLQMSAVKQFALEKGLKVLQPLNLKDENFLSELKALDANLQVVVAFRMLPEAVWKMPEYGTFNLHASLLPEYRGAAPINWAIINGETRTGVTTFFIDEKIDTGEIIMSREIEIGPNENAGSLHDRLMINGANLVTETLERIAEGPVKTQPQPKGDQDKKAYKLHKDNCHIEWSHSCRTVHNLVRGLSPYPGAWTTLHNQGKDAQVKLFSTAITHRDEEATPGKLTTEDKSLFVGCKDGWLEILEMQLPGKRRMPVKDILNGMEFDSEAYLG